MNEELSIKLARIRSLIRQRELDAVYLKRQDNFAWLTCGGINYVGLGEMGNCGLLVTTDALYAVTNTIESARMRDEERLEEMGFAIHAGIWHDNDFEANTLRELTSNGRIGFDHGSPLGQNVADDVKKMRFSLTSAEIERYREGGRLTALAIEETAATIRPDDTEFSVVGRLAEIVRAQGMDVVSSMCAADERIANYRHPVPTMKKIRERAQLGGNMRYKGLIICCTRFVNFAPVTEELARQYRANVEIDCTFIANSVPGLSYQHPLLAGKAAYEERGYGAEFAKHHQGGPIGYAARDYRLVFSHTGLIADNQAFCWNPSITGTKSEDTVVAAKDGAEFMTKPVIFPALEVNVNGKVYKRADILEK